MDEEDGRRQTVASLEKVSLISHADTHDNNVLTLNVKNEHRTAADVSSIDVTTTSTEDNGDELGGSVLAEEHRTSIGMQQHANERLSHLVGSKQTPNTVTQLLHKNLLPDQGIHLRGYPILEGPFTMKLLKFILWTFLLTAVIHVVVGNLFSDRDKSLRLWHIWVFEGDLMVRDTVVFFLVGRMWQKSGIDHLSFIGTAILANLYFEAQNFVPFLQHSVSLYQMHCIWPWTLWLFVLILIPSIGILVVAHVLRAHQDRILPMKLMELVLCFFFFVAPLIPSNYFHFHHWYAGWLIGMHANFDVWWSRFAMAWCWGMYMNGIAVSDVNIGCAGRILGVLPLQLLPLVFKRYMEGTLC
jgi:hypothetical protein